MLMLEPGLLWPSNPLGCVVVQAPQPAREVSVVLVVSMGGEMKGVLTMILKGLVHQAKEARTT